MSETSKPTWTPGPWTVTEPDNAGNIRIVVDDCDAGDDGRAIFTSNEVATVGDTKHAEADARLTAAAPALYEALAEIIADQPIGLSDDAILSRARAALAAARGDT